MLFSRVSTSNFLSADTQSILFGNATACGWVGQSGTFDWLDSLPKA